MIKNIVFDLGNVLLKDSPSIVLENINVSDEIRKNIESKFFNNWHNINLGKETMKEHFKNCKFDFNIDESVQEVLVNYYKYRPFNDEIIELMNKLKQNKYKIFILSNNNKETYEYLKNQPMFQCVDGWIISCDFHMVKPNKEIYIKLFEVFNIKPEECFFIDDRKENIETAKTLKMSGFTLDFKNQGIDKLIKELKQKHINV